jgi:hypothetical protein
LDNGGEFGVDKTSISTIQVDGLHSSWLVLIPSSLGFKCIFQEAQSMTDELRVASFYPKRKVDGAPLGSASPTPQP